MSFTKVEKTITAEQLLAILKLYEEGEDISRSRGAIHEIDLVFTESDQGIRHLYVETKDENELSFHISQKGNALMCDGVIG